MAQASFEPGISRSRVLRSAVAPHWLGPCMDFTEKNSIEFDKRTDFWLNLKREIQQKFFRYGFSDQTINEFLKFRIGNYKGFGITLGHHKG